MSFWGSISQESGQRLADLCSVDRPSVGKRIAIEGGKKHKGKVGVVVWHGRDRFTKAFRYGSDAQHAMTELMGRWGYRVGVLTDEGERFFVAAEHTKVLGQEAEALAAELAARRAA